eukprot:CAMPEP_0181234242 /NCGR_PEP_ID=MMETSP1096-20121128/36843_1 /TAXON_ID=156174 ORGANISM="Chrysochromulina ericina, Strain CCMP281" /NCGR_SAMPLE_ID=MMETSP1096 /ASSEMBLY_ACC=CAM_ASM_000453 /LENGTH=129 /DNA_ID=CAMNT_0023328953 /DNA_START=63 /DNA_END=456 /DNA_ORIENTATION=-
MPGTLPNRCFWHVHHSNGVSCVFRLGGCGEHMDIASPSELQAALHRASPRSVPTVTIEVSADVSAASAPAARLRDAIWDLEHLHAEAKVLLVRLTPPTTLALTGAQPTSTRATPARSMRLQALPGARRS